MTVSWVWISEPCPCRWYLKLGGDEWEIYEKDVYEGLSGGKSGERGGKEGDIELLISASKWNYVWMSWRGV